MKEYMRYIHTKEYTAALLAFVLLAAVPARADCRYTPDRADVVCSAGDFGWLMDQTTEAEHARDVARAANERLAGELARSNDLLRRATLQLRSQIGQRIGPPAGGEVN